MPLSVSARSRRAALVAMILLLPTGHAWAQRLERGRAARMLERPHVASQFIVKFRDAEAAPRPEDFGSFTAGGVRRMEALGTSGLHLVRAGGAEAVALEELSGHPDVEFIEPDYIVTASQRTPNDPNFGNLWALRNAARPGSDIAAVSAWGTTTGSRNIVVGVVDTGVDFNHPDLAPNMWSAPRAFTVTVGGSITVNCAAGTRGFNAINRTCVPMDDNGHGTHVAGTIGAAGNNNVGVTGVNWTTSLLGLKFLAANGSGNTSNAVLAIDFAIQLKRQFPNEANIRVLNNSWGGGGASQALEAIMTQANAADMLFVAAAGNEGANNDTTPNFPANSTQRHVISVAATDQNDALAGFSNFGQNVHLAAPGTKILSAHLSNSYASMSGTSMAAPHVAGAAALVLAACPLNTSDLKNLLLLSVDPLVALAGKTSTGGRLNVDKAIRQCAVPRLTLTATPSTRTLTQGETTTFTLQLQTSGTVTGTPTIQITGAPAGITPTVVGTPKVGGTVTVSVPVAATVPTGSYLLTAVFNMGASLRTTALLKLDVQAAQPFRLQSVGRVSVERGGSRTIPVQVIRQASFTGPISLSLQGLETGLSAAPVLVPTGASTAVITLVASQSARAFEHPAIRLVATGGTPSLTLTESFPLSVVTPAVPFTLTAPAALTLAPGTTAALPVAVSRLPEFTGVVALTVEGLPNGVSLNRPITVATGSTSGVLYLAATPTAPAGVVPIRVIGSGPSGQRTTLTVNLTVPTNLSVSSDQRSVTLRAGSSLTIPFRLISNTTISGFPSFSLAGGLPTGVNLSIRSGATPNDFTIMITSAATAPAAEQIIQVTVRIGTLIAQVPGIRLVITR
jgi:subtilisin family serine protease